MFTFYRELLCHNNDGTFGGWRVYVLAVKFNIRNMHDEISMKNDSEWALNSWFSLWLLSLCISLFFSSSMWVGTIESHFTLHIRTQNTKWLFNVPSYVQSMYLWKSNIHIDVFCSLKLELTMKLFFCKIINKKFKFWNNKIQQLNVKTFKTSRPPRALRVSSLENLFHLLLFFI